MIILSETVNNSNILHLIIGPETDDQFNFNGQSSMNITGYIKNMDPEKECIILINPCESEAEVIQTMQAQEEYRKANHAMNLMHKYMDKNNGNLPRNKKKSPEKKKPSGLTCPLCHAKNAGILIDGVIAPCLTCQEIDAGLKAIEISKPPSEDELKPIKKDLLKTNPDYDELLKSYLDEKQIEEDEDE